MASNAAFDAALQRFLDSLPEAERCRYSPCASAQDLLDGLHGLANLSEKRQKTRLNRVFASVKSFSDRLEPYFAAVDIFIQSNPQYSALVWGSVRLILQVSACCLGLEPSSGVDSTRSAR